MNATLSKPILNKPLLNKEDMRVRLLIVDDEQSIRKLCVTVGEALGFICLEAESGEDQGEQAYVASEFRLVVVAKILQ